MMSANRKLLTQSFVMLASLAGAAALPMGCAQAPKETRIIKVQMKKYSVVPNEIRVRRGEAVAIELTSADVQHGFDVVGMGISESIQPGEVARFGLKTDKQGVFEVTCGIICGPRHDEMRGKIIVQ
jgi:cytochrome c oxidase subunit II